MGTHAFAVPFQYRASLCLGVAASIAKLRIKEHFPDRHAGRLQAPEKLDPEEDRGIVIALAGLVPVGIGQQPDPLVVADRMGRQSGTPCQFTDLHTS